MSDITKLDKNFAALAVEHEGFCQWDVRRAPFSLHGLIVREDGGFCRIPQAVADATNPVVADLADNTAGGRLRFKTDSSRVVLKWRAPFVRDFNHMPRTGTAYFDLYADGAHIHTFIPSLPQQTDEEVVLEAMVHIPVPHLQEIEIYFPLYNPVQDVTIALEEHATVLPPDPYTYPLPVVFYGSSITQGGCASRGGMAYPAILERALSTEIVNLGFSGGCHAEAAMADYIATLPMSVFVLDYDHNADSPQTLRATHEPFFKRLRAARPDLPIVMVSAADEYLPGGWDVRRDIIRRTYENACAAGDKNVYFVDGHTFYAALGGRDALVDHTHPNDLGMYAMAKGIEPTLRALLTK